MNFSNKVLQKCLTTTTSYFLVPRGDLCVATKTNYVEILNFRHFFKHIVFTSEGDKIRNKEIKKYINVSVVVDIECGNTTN